MFTDIFKADPSENKMFTQWMLNTFHRLLKGYKASFNDENGNVAVSEHIDTTGEAIRFATEDLPMAKDYLIVFEANKRKKKFRELCSKNPSLKEIKDYSDINQYKSLSQLFDAVDPFIERNPTEMESLINTMVKLGEAVIAAKDRKFTLYIPKTRNASIIFENYTNWCTARKENSNFTSYTDGNRKPNGEPSDLYIIINNDFFKGKSEELYQIHFETNQLKNKQNTEENVSIFEDVLSKSEVLSDFFYKELIVMAKECKQGIDNNNYLNYLLKFGFAESLFEIFDEETTAIKIVNENTNNKKEIPKLPDLTRFKNLEQFILADAKLSELHPSIGNLVKLEMLTISDNNLTKLPKELGNLKKLEFINIVGNKIKDVPEEIGLLDRTRGGSLHTFSINKSDKNYERFKKLLPSVEFNLFEG